MFDTNNIEKCFSVASFDIVYNHINVQIKSSNAAFYKYDNYELYLTDASTISFKQNGYTLSCINKVKGIYSLAKIKKDNDRILMKTNQIFCKLLLVIN